ncbi:DUF2357 domain-containing protein [Pseudovibrio sp. JE062]|uniref:DUF2357 domain-containing protein n=1 Tax=Pseudovibrio sp. JE062 TaxID=439495 RepID=UPI000186C184|nr:DUF2357 domain-containing protein [Pseudovibrio sp. JE062]EEA95092.1 conserved hypothetical protein [Pseudovibrio sp. JE062]
MPSLHIISDASGASWQVWPSPETLPPGAIREASSYIFELRDFEHAIETDLLINEVPLEALRSRQANVARWRWKIGFHAGEISAELRRPDHRPTRFDLVTDPDLNKLTRSDFDAMVLEILQDSFALFSLTNFRKSIAHGVSGKPPAISRLEYLRSRIETLECVVREITRRPRRQLLSEERCVPYYKVRRINSNEIIRSFAHGRITRVPPTATKQLASLKGYLPTEFRTQNCFTSLDLPEHRQMAAVLGAWSAWLVAAAEQLDNVSKKVDTESVRSVNLWANRCRRISRRLLAMRSSEPFARLPPTKPQLQLTSLFRHDPNYRQFYKLYQEINYGLAAVFGDFLNLPLARTFELYELWCFLRLVRAGTEMFGASAIDFNNLFTHDALGGMTIATNAVTVKISHDWEIMFQKRYDEFWKSGNGRGSFSRTMTPDVVVANKFRSHSKQSKLIVLDAKYRIDSALNDAISAIHTYRDALVEEVDNGKFHGIVCAAYLLTPHIPELAAQYRETSMPGRLFHPDYRSTFRFGAATLKPGMKLSEISTCLQAIISDAGVATRSP